MAVCCVLVGLVNVCEIVAWLFCAEPPVINPVTTGAVHEYVVPFGTMVFGLPLIGLTRKLIPLQTLLFCAGMDGIGLMVTTSVKFAP